MKKFKEIDWKTGLTITIAIILASKLASGLIDGIYYVGLEVGRALARLF